MTSFLDHLEPAAAAALRACATERSYAAGAALFHERQLGDRVLVIIDGRVKLITTTEGGREMLLALRGAGELLGELTALDGGPRSASAFAVEPVRALSVSARDFVRLVEEYPSVARTVIGLLAERLRDADRRRLEFLAQDTVGRVAARLVELAAAYGVEEDGAIRIALPISQDELAGWIGASREAVTKALGALRNLGWIETGRRTVRIRDLDALTRRSA